jgi:hypothetical protein
MSLKQPNKPLLKLFFNEFKYISFFISFIIILIVNLLKKNGVKVFAVCPGHVKTQLNPTALTQPETCALNLIYLISNATNKLNGKFIDLTNGKEINW